MALPSVDVLVPVGYVAAFAIAGAVCLGALRALPRIEDPDTRRGLGWLLALSSAWAFAHVGYLLAPDPSLQYALFVVGLLVGFAAVGPWLYFCSAFTGRSLHRDSTVRWAAVGVFLGIGVLKLTNPVHGLYFTADPVAEPFAHLAIHHGPIHWVVMGLAYALAVVGFFMLFELFLEVSYDTRPLIAVVGLTGLPVVFDVFGAVSPFLLDVTHSPLGVAAFAVGMLYVFVDRFQTVRLTGEADEPVILLDADGRLRAWNGAANTLFPSLDDAHRRALDDVLPVLADAVDGTSQIVRIGDDDDAGYYRVSTAPFSAESTRLGTMITVTDVSDQEAYRRRLERQNDRLEEFASIVSHDLRNPLNVAEGRLELVRETGDFEHLDHVDRAHERMGALIEDVLELARAGVQIDETEPVALGRVVDECWEMVETGAATLSVEDVDMEIQADEDRLRQLIENLFRNAIDHGGPDVTITVGSLPDRTGFFVADDGEGVPTDERDRIFEPGVTTREDGTGFGLAIVADIVTAHGWGIDVTESEDGGARFEVRTLEGGE